MEAKTSYASFGDTISVDSKELAGSHNKPFRHMKAIYSLPWIFYLNYSLNTNRHSMDPPIFVSNDLQLYDFYL